MILKAIVSLFEVLFLLAGVLAILLMIASGIWTYLTAKYDEDVEKEVQRRVDETFRDMRVNIHIDVVEDTLGHEERYA